LLETVCDKVLIFRPPFAFLCGSPLSFLVVKLKEPFDRFKRRYNAYTVFAPCGHFEKNAALHCRGEVEIALLPLDDLHSQVHRIIEGDLLRLIR
jgi:hypothetical protein